MRHILSFSGGKDSTATLLLILEKGRPLDEIVFFDWGVEFPQMYDHIAKVEQYTGIKITRLYPYSNFVYQMTERPITARKGPKRGHVYRYGYGWPSYKRRWCTREKVSAIRRHCGDAIQYLGIAADEANRLPGLSKNPLYRFPLVEYGVTEADALAICRAEGFDWGGLYESFCRLSCFCCPLKRVAELRTLRRKFPELWSQMLEWDSRLEPNYGFRGTLTVRDLDVRFSNEDCQLSFWGR